MGLRDELYGSALGWMSVLHLAAGPLFITMMDLYLTYTS